MRITDSSHLTSVNNTGPVVIGALAQYAYWFYSLERMRDKRSMTLYPNHNQELSEITIKFTAKKRKGHSRETSF